MPKSNFNPWSNTTSIPPTFLATSINRDHFTKPKNQVDTNTAALACLPNAFSPTNSQNRAVSEFQPFVFTSVQDKSALPKPRFTIKAPGYWDAKETEPSLVEEEEDDLIEEYYQFGEISRERVRLAKIFEDGKKSFSFDCQQMGNARDSAIAPVGYSGDLVVAVEKSLALKHWGDSSHRHQVIKLQYASKAEKRSADQAKKLNSYLLKEISQQLKT